MQNCSQSGRIEVPLSYEASDKNGANLAYFCGGSPMKWKDQEGRKIRMERRGCFWNFSPEPFSAIPKRIFGDAVILNGLSIYPHTSTCFPMEKNILIFKDGVCLHIIISHHTKLLKSVQDNNRGREETEKSIVQSKWNTPIVRVYFPWEVEILPSKLAVCLPCLCN